MARFKITYTDPETGARVSHIGEYADTSGVVTDGNGKVLHEGPPITARMWAEDHAYSLADKSTDYVIHELPF